MNGESPKGSLVTLFSIKFEPLCHSSLKQSLLSLRMTSFAERSGNFVKAGDFKILFYGLLDVSQHRISRRIGGGEKRR